MATSPLPLARGELVAVEMVGSGPTPSCCAGDGADIVGRTADLGPALD